MLNATLERCRILLAAADGERDHLHDLLTADGPWHSWDVAEADSFEQARFLVQMDACDVLLLDSSLEDVADAGGIAWLASRLEAPVVYLAEPTAKVLRGAMQPGSYAWLPRGLALDQPLLLHSAVQQAVRVGELQRELALAGEALQECRDRVDRLVGRLWECAPVDGTRQWFSQRHMVERLNEEVARAERHGGPLSVVLGELDVEGRPEAEGPGEWTRWAADCVSRAKRRCDVAGQYGPNGFMLVLPRTPEAGAKGCCQRLRQLLELTGESLDGPSRALRARFGVASFASSSATASIKGLLGQAEDRLERARGGDPEEVVS